MPTSLRRRTSTTGCGARRNTSRPPACIAPSAPPSRSLLRSKDRAPGPRRARSLRSGRGRASQPRLLRLGDQRHRRREILVVFSHTHGAGLMGLDRAGLPGGEHIPPYLDQLGKTVGTLAKNALASLVPASIVYGRGRCGLATHRDFWDGSQYICGHNPGVPVDDTVVVSKVCDEAGSTLATVVNYACHPTTLAWTTPSSVPNSSARCGSSSNARRAPPAFSCRARAARSAPARDLSEIPPWPTAMDASWVTPPFPP